MTTKSKTIESFNIDHLHMDAPQIRMAGQQSGPQGDQITKFDLRFLKPNTTAMPTAAIHTLEHLLATYLRNYLDNVIDLSPMGCRTGFYLSLWGEVQAETVQSALIKSLKRVLETEWADVPGTTAKECGNYQDHSLDGAKEYAAIVLDGLGAK